MRPFMTGDSIDIFDPLLQPTNTGKVRVLQTSTTSLYTYLLQDIVGLFCVRHDAISSPSFRDVQTLRILSRHTSKPALQLVINLPAVTKESWIYAMTYKCYCVSSPHWCDGLWGVKYNIIYFSGPQSILMNIPSLAADTAKDYATSSNLHPTLASFCSADTSAILGKAAQDTIVQTVNTELALQQVHTEIQVVAPTFIFITRLMR